MSRILLSAFADEYNSDIDIQIKMLRENNIGYIEPRFIGPKNIADLTVEETKELKSKLGDLKVSSIGSPLGKINLADNFEEHLEKTKRVLETAAILDCRNIRMFSFYLHEGKTRKECRSEVIEKLGRMIDLAKPYNVNLCHENEAKIYGESPEMCLDLLENFKGDLKCVFDMGNFVLDGCDPLKGYEMLKNYIEYFHIKDSLPEGAIVPPGLGKGHIKEILDAYSKDFDRDFIITLEPHLQTFDGFNALTDSTFDNPYKYNTQEEAFLDALEKLRKII